MRTRVPTRFCVPLWQAPTKPRQRTTKNDSSYYFSGRSEVATGNFCGKGPPHTESKYTFKHWINYSATRRVGGGKESFLGDLQKTIFSSWRGPKHSVLYKVLLVLNLSLQRKYWEYPQWVYEDNLLYFTRDLLRAFSYSDDAKTRALSQNYSLWLLQKMNYHLMTYIYFKKVLSSQLKTWLEMRNHC